MDNMPQANTDVTCPYCWWRGKRACSFSDPSLKPCPRCGKRVSTGWLFKTVEAVQSLNQLYEKLEQLKAHVCSWDQRESACPVCADEMQIEHQIRLLGGRVRRPNRV